MKLIFAQGNPDKKYTHTRHNVGFMMLDKFATTRGASFVHKPKFYADIAELTINDEKILLAKPTTYYNETGRSARALIDFYKLIPATDVLVMYDELALPFGTIRTRQSGEAAGNNGIKSLNTYLGNHYLRVRIGIYNDTRIAVHDAEFVLQAFTLDEKNALPVIYEQVERFTNGFIDDHFEITKVSIA